MKIKSGLILTFFISLASVLAAFSFFVRIEIDLKNNYKATADRGVIEYEIVDLTRQLSSVYSSLLISPDDKSLNEHRQNIFNKLDTNFTRLDPLVTDQNSISIYSRLKNRVFLLKQNIEQGIRNAKVSDFSKNAEILEQISRGVDNIENDTSALVFSNLQESLNKQTEAQQTETATLVIGVAVVLLVLLGSSVLGVANANSLINPLERLSKLSEDISKGDTYRTVDDDLMKMKNEIGILSRTLNGMIVNVEGKINTRTLELQQERARLLASINSLSLGFILFNLENEIILKNSAVERLLNATDKELSLDWINHELGIYISIENCKKDKTQCEFKEIDWKDKILRILVIPVLVEERNETIGFVLIIEDITEEKILDRTKDDFFAIASHELRTPLTAIKGNTEIIQTTFSDSIKNPEVLDMIKDIHDESVRLIGITNDFLDVSRIEAHKVRLSMASINMNEIAENMANEMKNLVARKNISLVFKRNDTIPNVVGDKNRIRQILMNLVANALNNTEQGSITLSLSVENGFVKTSIADTGTGILPENQKLLFRKFQQANADIYTRGAEKGIGIGLYISRLLIGDMNGEIWLEKSEIGKGSVFSFTLPVMV